jgi:uncharacterized membrane protein
MKLFVKIFLPLLLLLFFVNFTKTSFAKSFYFPNVQTDILINNDASISVSEIRTTYFDGSFSQIYWDIPLKPQQKIENVIFSDENGTFYQQTNGPDTVSRPKYTFSAVSEGNTEHIEAYFSASNENKTFKLNYTVTNAITKYNDVAELYWKVIGDNWGTKTGQVVSTITLPEMVSKSSIYIWGHGPLNGKSEIIDGKTTRFTVQNVPSNTFVEIRELFPKSIISSLNTVNENALQRIKNEESGFQKQTILREQFQVISIILLIIFIIAWIIFWTYVWFKYGKEYHLDTPKYIHNPPSNLEPALVESLVNQGLNITPNSFSATILDLARKKYIKIEAQQTLSQGFFRFWKRL